MWLDGFLDVSVNVVVYVLGQPCRRYLLSDRDARRGGIGGRDELASGIYAVLVWCWPFFVRILWLVGRQPACVCFASV